MKPTIPCAIYTRKSSEEGLEQDFNSLHAQREACQAFVLSQKAEGWKALPDQYDDGGYSGGNMERPALQRLIDDIAAGKVKIVVVYKVDRLTRSLADFAKLVEQFDGNGVSFVSVTQQFNTTTSMGRLTLNVLLSFAQFEREVTGERIRDKIAASKKKGMWMGGFVPIGYRSHERTLAIDDAQAERIRTIYRRYLELGNVKALKTELDRIGWTTPTSEGKDQRATGGKPFSRGHLYRILSNPIYRGQISHKGILYAGQHPPIVEDETWSAVQKALAKNRCGRKLRVDGKEPSLLAGKIFDGTGDRLTPTHACKGSRRYRYYVSQRLVGRSSQEAPERGATDLRIPAPELEGAVKRLLVEFLKDADAMLGRLGELEAFHYPAVLEQAKGYRSRLQDGTSLEQRIAIDELVERVTVAKDRLEINIRRDSLVAPVSESNHAPICLTQPMAFRRSGFGLRLVIPGKATTDEPQVDHRLLRFVQRGAYWFRRLVTDGVGPSAIAADEGVSASLVQRIIYAAFLAPDIVAMIEAGRHPITLTADSLLKALPLPADWHEQRKLLSIPIVEV